jgi:hypothetical protein
MFIQIKDGQPFGYPVTDENLRALVPANVSLPQYPLTVDVLPFGFAVYEYAQKPEYPASAFKVVYEGNPVWTHDDIRGEYVTQVWDVRDMTPQEKDAATQAQWQLVENERNQKLYLCDWTQLPDVPLTPAQVEQWRVYRQQLRDVTNQPDPFNITWPVAPQA